MLFVPCARSHCDRASQSLQPHGVCRVRSSWVGHPQARHLWFIAPSYRVTPSPRTGAARRSSSAAMPFDRASCSISHSISGHYVSTVDWVKTGRVTIGVCLFVCRSRVSTPPCASGSSTTRFKCWSVHCPGNPCTLASWVILVLFASRGTAPIPSPLRVPPPWKSGAIVSLSSLLIHPRPIFFVQLHAVPR